MNVKFSRFIRIDVILLQPIFEYGISQVNTKLPEEIKFVLV